MIFITGDCHGEFRRFRTKNFPEQKDMTKEDYVIICGDFGGVWNQSKEERHWLDWLSEKPFTTLFVDGNHENFDLLNELPVTQWHGGNVQFVTPSIIHLMRGQVYDLEGLKLFTFGGARSHDMTSGVLDKDDPDFVLKRRRLLRDFISFRINHESWWAEEMPTEEEMAEGLNNLEKAGWEVDFVFTHCCASSTQGEISYEEYEPDELTEYFERIKEKITFKKWFFGHYHENQNVTDREIALYEQIIRIE